MNNGNIEGQKDIEAG